MTTIAVNRRGMASDSQMSEGSIKTSVVKMWRIRGWLLAGTGNAAEVAKLIREIKEQREYSPREIFDKVDMGKIEECDIVLLSPSGKLYASENGTECIELSDPFYALGTGAQAALAVMHMGQDPRAAVRIAAKIDSNTGGKVVWKTI